HFFGLFQKRTQEIKGYLEKKRIMLIEDCAHVIPMPNQLMGKNGDISFFTPRKYLPLLDGAMIKINNPRLLGRIRNKQLPIYNEKFV
ncbi:hypothetical protein ACFL9T_20155, partial [Thermodesulfobacteriota bacterium]